MEDGLLLNIVSGPATATKQKLAGGRWTDRVKHNKREHRRTHRNALQPSQKPSSVQSDVSVQEVNLPQLHTEQNVIPNTVNAHLKRKRASADESEKEDYLRKKSQQEPSSELGASGERVAGQVVSSLFDYHDPLPVMAPTAKVKSADPVVASTQTSTTGTDSFETLGIIPELVQIMADKMSAQTPTPIQQKTLPTMLTTAKDIFIRAETGSGKTLAYLLPILNRLSQLPQEWRAREKGCYAMIIAPTRELAQQIYNVLEVLLNSRRTRWMVGVLLIGGEKKKSEKARLRKGANIVIATPGRLKDHLDSTQVLNVSAIKWVVLDEGDRLMDLGFEASIIEILDIIKERATQQPHIESLPVRRITIICSATAKENITKLGDQSLQDAVFIDGREDGAVSEEGPGSVAAPSQLKQEYITVPTKLRLVALVAALKKAFTGPRACKKVIVFLSCGDTVDFHFDAFTRPDGSEDKSEGEVSPALSSIAEGPLISPGLKVHKLHGSMQQHIRTQTLKLFSTCSEPAVLVCTDVASRGLDLQVDYIVQYDPPFSIDDYTHRIGRTARAGRSGSALLFMLKSEREYVDLIDETLKCSVSEVNVKFLLKAAFGPDFEDGATKWQTGFEKWVMGASVIERAKTAFTSHVRAYATHTSSERRCFPIHGLQLGHVAKTFGLRDAPSNIGHSLPKRGRPKAGAGAGSKAELARLKEREAYGPTDIQTRMRKSIAAQGKVSEFNLM